MEELIELLKSNNLTIASAESLTAGLFGATLASVPGASSVYKGSIVSYASEIKHKVLKVDQTIIDNYGVVSKECAYSMVEHLNEIMNVEIGVSFTGNAGPSVMEDKPVGLVYIGINVKGKITTYELHIKGERNEIRKSCVDEAVKLLKKII